MTAEPGSKSPPPFHFSCQRSGNCCRVGTGHVWIDHSDLASYAELTETTVEAFVGLNVVQVGERLSLRERADGRCILLDGHNRCSIYEQRPDQCRSFPYWPELLSNPIALKRAAQYCPGIQLFPNAQLCREVLPQVAIILDALLQRQLMCTETSELTERSGLTSAKSLDQESIRWANALEVDLHLATGVERRIVEPELVAELGQQLQHLAEVSGYPWSSAAWPRLLEDRRDGWLQRGGLPTLP